MTAAFKADLPEGKGKITYPDGSTYEGDWKAGAINGGKGTRHLCQGRAGL